MRNYFLYCIGLILFGFPCYAEDFQLSVIEEHYRETQEEYAYHPIVYHSIQVQTDMGSKILVLTGDDHIYRKWLRHYISGDKGLIARVPQDRTDEFVSAKIYELDVTALHPYNPDRWTVEEKSPSARESMVGDNHILVVDADPKRSSLVQSVLERMQYQTLIFNEGQPALTLFKIHPQKFKMVIIHHNRLQPPADRLVDEMVRLNPSVPIVIDTGYAEDGADRETISKFSGFGSVHVRSVILRDLQRTIENLIKTNA